MQELWHQVRSLGGLVPFMRSMTDAFGWRYVATVLLVYGVNQGVGEPFIFTAQRYFLYDVVDVSPSVYGRLEGFANIPWQIKALWGLLSDSCPINGYHRSPYILMAGIVGLVSLGALVVFNSFGVSMAGLLLLAANLSMATPDVMIDATVAQRAKERPDLAPSVQALCWGSLGFFGFFGYIVVGYLIEEGGPRLAFTFALASSVAAVVPSALGWVGEQRNPERKCVLAAKQLCARLLAEPTKRAVAMASLLVGGTSLLLGISNMLLAEIMPNTVAVGTVVAACAMCYGVFKKLGRIDECLAKAALFTFASKALCPSTFVLFSWYHDDEAGNCYSTAQCAADDEPPDDCGWARERGYPCLSPSLIGWGLSISMISLTFGTALYAKYMNGWTYARICTVGQVLLIAVNLLDMVWVLRWNTKVGISDAAFLLGDEVLAPVVDRIVSMPLLIFAAKLCPPKVEAAMFALFMGLSNFGVITGYYVGSGMLFVFGVDAPEYDHLTLFVFVRSCMRALPILLVPWLLPKGTPLDDAKAMGAGPAVVEESAEPLNTRDDSDVFPDGRGQILAERTTQFDAGMLDERHGGGEAVYNPAHGVREVEVTELRPARSNNSDNHDADPQPTLHATVDADVDNEVIAMI